MKKELILLCRLILNRKMLNNVRLCVIIWIVNLSMKISRIIEVGKGSRRTLKGVPEMLDTPPSQ